MFFFLLKFTCSKWDPISRSIGVCAFVCTPHVSLRPLMKKINLIEFGIIKKNTISIYHLFWINKQFEGIKINWNYFFSKKKIFFFWWLVNMLRWVRWYYKRAEIFQTTINPAKDLRVFYFFFNLEVEEEEKGGVNK